MSRAPAPKLSNPVTNTPIASNLYGNMAAYPMVPSVNSGMHPMQSVYHNMQLQQPLQPQQLPLTQQQMPAGYGGYYTNAHSVQPPGSTMQNVSVVDFKPDVLAQHQMHQLQHQYQANVNAMGVPAVPTMGLVGPDGRYQPVTAASSSYGRQEDYNARGFEPQQDRYPQEYPFQESPEALQSMIEASVRKCINKQNLQKTANSSLRPNNEPSARVATASAFKDKSQEQQRHIVGAAVDEVMKKYEVKRATPGISSEKKSGTSQRFRHSFDDY